MTINDKKTGEEFEFPSDAVFREMEKVGLVIDGDLFSQDRFDEMSFYSWAFLWDKQHEFESWFCYLENEKPEFCAFAFTMMVQSKLGDYLSDDSLVNTIDMNFALSGHACTEYLRFVAPKKPDGVNYNRSVAFTTIYRNMEISEILTDEHHPEQCLN